MTDNGETGKWKRRARTIPTVLVATSAMALGSPVWIPLAVLRDLASRRRRLPTLRAGLFAMRYLWNDSAEIVAAPALWLEAAMRGGPSGDPAGRYRAIQQWSIRTLAASADRFIGVRVDAEAAVPVAPHSGPYIVLCQHVSMLDTSLPSLIFGLDSPWHVRGIATNESLNDPGFDLIYPALGTVFIDRNEGQTARAVIAGFSRFDGLDDVATIFPEGRLGDPSAIGRSLERIAKDNPLRAERLRGLQHVLPPRPGGTLALLNALPTADVLIVGHTGFEGAASIADMVRNAPLDATVTVDIRHIQRSEIPRSDADRAEWLDRQWLELDSWLDTTKQPRPKRVR